MAERPAPDIAIDLSAEAAHAAIRAGEPLLATGALACDPDELREELHRVAEDLADTAEPGSAAQRSAERLANAPLQLAPLLQPALSGDRAAIEREAYRLDVDPTAFERMLDLVLQPFLWEATAQLAVLTDMDRWDRGYCPVCGAWPALAEMVGPEKRRVLRCVRCGVAWSWLLLLCPYCGNDDHRSLGVLSQERGPERVDVCQRCHGYLKAVQTFASHSAPRLVAEDVATLHLDLGAAEAGYQRPGDVDVSIAGIPRLVREHASASEGQEVG